MTWRCLNPKQKEMCGHLFYTDGERIAIADWSIRDRDDPASTDDGLLLVDFKRPMKILASVDAESDWSFHFWIPVIDSPVGRRGSTFEGLPEGIETAHLLKKHGMRFEIDHRLSALAHNILALEVEQDWS